jgi:CubicO group peptidase (beta-lactamase class C family)
MKSGRRWCLAFLLLIVAATLWVPRASAADLVDPAQVDALVKPLIDSGWVYGAAVGLINDQGTETAGYGRISESNDKAPGADTLFEIGSISKVFTGLILAKMVEDHIVSLAEGVQSLLGDSISVPKGEREITLVDLATHSSGLPRMPSNFAPKDPANPYADYTVDQMATFLAGHKLRREPGEKYEYSNLAVGLLGHALARKSDMPYEALLTKTICQPLALNDTVITLDDAHMARLAAGHDVDGRPAANWDLPTLAGAGAIRSTTADMLKFLAANMGLSHSPLDAAMQLSHQVQFKNPNGADVALGWHWIRDRKLIWHNGGTAGYHAYAAFNPEKKIGIVVLANSAVGQVDALGLALVKLLETGEAEPLKLPKTIAVIADDLEPLVGAYQLAPFSTAKVTRVENRLFVQLTGQPQIGLYPTSKTSFFCRPVDASFDFETGDDGKIARMVVHQNGQDIPAQKTQ